LPRRRKRPPEEGRLIQGVYYGYVAFSALARAIPESVAYALAHVAGTWAAKRSKKRGQVAANLSRVVGEPADSIRVQRLVVAAFRSYARYWLETFRLVREGSDFFLERFQGVGAEHIDEPLSRGQGVVVAVGHQGNWDAAGAWASARWHHFVTVAEVLRPRRMFDFFADHRARLGMTILPAEPGVTDRLVQAVEDGAVVAILADRDLKGKGPTVTFFGEPTTFPAGAASVALRTGAPLLVAGVYSIKLPGGKRGWMADISAPLEIPEPGPDALQLLTQRIASGLEEAVRSRPEEWHVFQPFWSADRPPR
jgi:phosphatidylinositol dimannoside acyltransferase